MGGVDLRLGRWEEVLADVGEVDAVITDPPYSERTHSGHGRDAAGLRDALEASRPLTYSCWGEDDVAAFVSWWSPRCLGWFCVMSDHESQRTWEEHLQEAGRYVFAPLPLYCQGGGIRLCGDGPSSWTVWLTVARPKSEPYASWGTLPGGYVYSKGNRRENHIGGKPLGLMRQILGDYTNPGDTVVDPCAGYGTTLLAARELGCHGIGAERDPETYAKATARLAKPWQPMPHPRAGRGAKSEQRALF